MQSWQRGYSLSQLLQNQPQIIERGIDGNNLLVALQFTPSSRSGKGGLNGSFFPPIGMGHSLRIGPQQSQRQHGLLGGRLFRIRSGIKV